MKVEGPTSCVVFSDRLAAWDSSCASWSLTLFKVISIDDGKVLAISQSLTDLLFSGTSYGVGVGTGNFPSHSTTSFNHCVTSFGRSIRKLASNALKSRIKL